MVIYSLLCWCGSNGTKRGHVDTSNGWQAGFEATIGDANLSWPDPSREPHRATTLAVASSQVEVATRTKIYDMGDKIKNFMLLIHHESTSKSSASSNRIRMSEDLVQLSTQFVLSH
jgi:hypothetical protein